jgi:hypothetical protein
MSPETVTVTIFAMMSVTALLLPFAIKLAEHLGEELDIRHDEKREKLRDQMYRNARMAREAGDD